MNKRRTVVTLLAAAAVGGGLIASAAASGSNDDGTDRLVPASKVDMESGPEKPMSGQDVVVEGEFADEGSSDAGDDGNLKVDDGD